MLSTGNPVYKHSTMIRDKSIHSCVSSDSIKTDSRIQDRYFLIPLHWHSLGKLERLKLSHNAKFHGKEWHLHGPWNERRKGRDGALKRLPSDGKANMPQFNPTPLDHPSSEYRYRKRHIFPFKIIRSDIRGAVKNAGSLYLENFCNKARIIAFRANIEGGALL